MLTRDLTDAWLVVLEADLAHSHSHSQICRELCASLLEGDLERFQHLLRRQVTLAEQDRVRRDRIAAIRQRTAKELAVPVEDLVFDRVLAAAPEDARAALAARHAERGAAGDELRRLIDRNALLVRTNLNLVRDGLELLIGPRIGDGYSARGRPCDRAMPAGSVLNIRS